MRPRFLSLDCRKCGDSCLHKLVRGERECVWCGSTQLNAEDSAPDTTVSPPTYKIDLEELKNSDPQDDGFDIEQLEDN